MNTALLSACWRAMVRKRRWFGFIAAALALALTPTPARAVDFGDAEVVAEDDLAGMRGGFITAGGFQIDFGAIVKTFVDGELALATVLSWSQAGIVVEQSYGQLGQPLSELANDAQHPLNISGLTAGGSGIVLSDGQGVTALVHRVIDGQFQNFIVNEANGRDLRQEIELTITLPGFEAAQEALSFDKLGLQIFGDMGQSAGF